MALLHMFFVHMCTMASKKLRINLSPKCSVVVQLAFSAGATYVVPGPPKGNLRIIGTGFLQAGCPSLQPPGADQ